MIAFLIFLVVLVGGIIWTGIEVHNAIPDPEDEEYKDIEN